MYHRIAESASDVWNLAVTPTRFEQQLRILKRYGNVISADELAEQLNTQRLQRRSIVITFDDGYVDNYLIAKPLLEHYKLPATFFITTGNIERSQEFWWDELERIFLTSEQLPQFFQLTADGYRINADLQAEQHLSNKLRKKHSQWKVEATEPPSLRTKLFYQLWKFLKPLPYDAQQHHLHYIREWAGSLSLARPDYCSMSWQQLYELSCNIHFTIGAHTITHPALANHQPSFQEQELLTSRQALTQVIGKEVGLLSYPYGSHSYETTAIATAASFGAAFTTEAKSVTRASSIYKLGRFQVNNWDSNTFDRLLSHWFNYC